MASESENRKLNDLRVVDLRSELEKRDLDKTGVKAVLLERLQKALEEEGHNPETYVFDLPAPDVKRTPGRGKKSDNDEVSEDDKLEEEEETQSPAKKNSETCQGTTNNVDKTPEKAGQVIIEEIKVESGDTDKKTPSTEDGLPPKKDSDNGALATAEKPNDNISSIKEENGPVNETCVKEEPAEKTEKVQPKSDESKEKTSAAESSEPPVPSTAIAPTATPTVKDEKQTSEANGIIDNEDSINLTIGEDEAKMLADEEDSSQEKDHKDESHGSSSHKKSGSGEKTQDKTNQEKADGKSSGTGDKTTKDEKSKKSGLGVAGTGSGGSSRNLWVSGLATTTRATDLKQVFSKYGKVVGAKVVTNARTPGARCYGYVTMSSADDANRAAQHLHHTELHGRLISVEKAKGDSSGPPKRTEPPTKITEPAKKVEEKKKEPVLRKTEVKKEENIVPPGTEGEVKEPAAPGTEEAENHRSREREARADREREKRPRSENSSHRSRGASPVLTFDKIKEERERIRQRVKERMYREEERRRETERIRQREIERKQREEFERLERERKKLKLERERIMREKDELLKIKSERQRLERERQKLERERLEKEKEELERLKRQNLRLEEEARRKRSLSESRDREYKRPATEARYAPQSSSSTHNHHSSAPTRYAEPPRSAEYKKEPTHKSSRDIGGVSRRPGFEPETSRRLVTSVSASSRESWPPKERESSRYERAPVSSSSFREESRSSKPSESRHVRERYSDSSSKGERFVERNSDSWPVKNFSSRDTWVSGERKPEHAPEPWARPTNNTTRWPSGSTGISLSSRGGPQPMSSPMFGTNSIQNMPSMNMGISMSPFSGGDRFDAYKQPYFKGP